MESKSIQIKSDLLYRSKEFNAFEKSVSLQYGNEIRFCLNDIFLF